MDELEEYQEWLYLTWGFGMTSGLPCVVQQGDEVEGGKEG